MWAATRDLGLEGVVAKDPRSPWVPRRSRRWLKCKHWRYGTFTVVGWAASTAKEPGGLVLGAPGAVGEMRVVGVAPLHVDPGHAGDRHGTHRRAPHRPGPVVRPTVAPAGPVGQARAASRGAVPGAHPDRDAAPRLGPAGEAGGGGRLSVVARSCAGSASALTGRGRNLNWPPVRHAARPVLEGSPPLTVD